MTLAEVMTIYEGSDGEATRRLYAELETRGPLGVIAVNVFRACKSSQRAKVYRGGAAQFGRRQSFRGMAYDRKHWAMGNLAKSLEEHGAALGITWGWGEDPAQEMHRFVLYLDLPDVGQVSFHDSSRGDGPDYPLPWDGQRGAAPQRACVFAARVLERAPPAQLVTPAATVPTS